MPRLMLDTLRVSHLWYYAVGPMAVLVVLALVLLWLRHRLVLDLWLMVVLWAYAIEIALTAFPRPREPSIHVLERAPFEPLSECDQRGVRC